MVYESSGTEATRDSGQRLCHQREDKKKKRRWKEKVTMQVGMVDQRARAEETSSPEKSGRRLRDLHWSRQLAGAR